MNQMNVFGLIAAGVCLIAMLPPAEAQFQVPTVQYPKIAATGRDAAAFAPPGWVVETQMTGDLNGDGRADLAFVLQQTDKRNVLANDGMGVQEIDTNPRILCVAFANADGSGYTLAIQNHTLIPRWTEPTLDDNFGPDGGEIKIARGALLVSLHSFANAGGWSTGTTAFTFRFQHGGFELIGFDNDDLERNTGVETTTSVNYSTRNETIVTTEDAGGSRTKRKTVPQRALLTMEQVGDGMEFQAPE